MHTKLLPHWQPKPLPLEWHTMTDWAASLSSIQKTYQLPQHQVEALRDVDLDIALGSFVAIMGASGSGKSTLLHVLAGLDQPSSGTVLVGNTDLGQLNDSALTRFRREQIGLIFQAYNLVPALSVIENVTLPLLLAGGDPDTCTQQALEQLTLVGLEDRRSHAPDQLSGGEQQRVAIARALVTKPQLILADEPTGNLDSVTANHIAKLFQQLHRERQTTIVMITHEAQLASYAEEVVLLADGQICGRLQGDDISDPQRLAQNYLKLAGQPSSVVA